MTQPAPQRPSAPAAPLPSGPAGLPAPADDDPTPLTASYDPAEYRWVPVRRRARYDGWTEEKQRRFIEVLADTGLVGFAAREVGMTRQSAYRLRRSTHGGAFARAWDRARELAGALIEDIAFERAIEGVEVETYDGNGELKDSRIVYSDRLLTFLLRHLKPEHYSAAARERKGGAWPDGRDGHGGQPSLDEALRAMEPQPPAPPETLADDGDLENDLLVAEISDGVLPPHLSEQRAPKSPEQLRAEAAADLFARGEAAHEKLDRGEDLTPEEYDAWCALLDPAEGARMLRTRRKPRKARKAAI
jgi:hypothetical protein